jgi:hypothetical protein
MRSRMLIPAAMAVTVLLALAPASAFAYKHHSPRGRCGVSMQVAPTHIVAGDSAIVFGRLRCDRRAKVGGQEVKLYAHLVGVPGFTAVQSTTTEGRGFYEFSPADSTIETSRYFFVRSHGARSATKPIRVAAQVTLNGPAEGQLLTGFPNRVTFTGSLPPADAGARVILQRQNALTGNQWRHIDSGVVEPSGDFTIVHTFVVPGDANIRVLVRSQGRNVPSESNVLAYSVSQAQNPDLTIQASADPIAFGETVTISGKLTSGGAGPITLLAHTARQGGFAPVAQSSTNAAGEYTFPAQAPVNSTFYKVQAAPVSSCAGLPPGASCPPAAARSRKVSSAVLYEGAKDTLTAQAAPTTVQAGQSVTFSGAVSPEHVGHVVYLERQNAHDPGFHVVQVAIVGAGSTYSITHRLYDTGSKVLRVSIPGDPDNEGTVSQPFTIQVTSAPASALTPEAPENSILPPEGES